MYVVTPHLMNKAKRKMVVMHPLPRIDEIRSALLWITDLLYYLKRVSLRLIVLSNLETATL